MNGLEAVIAGAIQGMIEWLPISSEAQTMLYMLNILNIDPQTALSYAFYLHFGTMLAVIIKFRNELISIMKSPFPEFKLSAIIIFGSIFTAITGIPLYIILRNVSVGGDSDIFTLIIGLMLIITGIVMKHAKHKGHKDIEEINNKDIFLTGIAQGFAIIPGISRSGITITTLLIRNVKQETALTISFLLSVPATMGILLLDFNALSQIPFQSMIILTISSLFFGYISMDFLLKFAKNVSFWKFCIIFGLITLIFIGIDFFV